MLFFVLFFLFRCSLWTRFTINYVTIALMVAAIVSSISAKKMTEGQYNKRLYTPKRVSMLTFLTARKAMLLRFFCLFCH